MGAGQDALNTRIIRRFKGGASGLVIAATGYVKTTVLSTSSRQMQLHTPTICRVRRRTHGYLPPEGFYYPNWQFSYTSYPDCLRELGGLRYVNGNGSKRTLCLYKNRFATVLIPNSKAQNEVFRHKGIPRYIPGRLSHHSSFTVAPLNYYFQAFSIRKASARCLSIFFVLRSGGDRNISNHCHHPVGPSHNIYSGPRLSVGKSSHQKIPPPNVRTNGMFPCSVPFFLTCLTMVGF